jgi:3-hydroxyisobutyrate dehydrogenase-like beta-hydroxyacid dehydrogenase
VAAEAFSTGATGSPHVKLHSKNMAESIREEPVSFSGNNRIKDTKYGIQVIESLGAEAILGRATVEVWERMVEQDMGDRNDSELIDALRAAAKKRHVT